MPAPVKGIQRRFILNLAPDTAAKLHARWESLQKNGRPVTRSQLVRDAIEAHLSSRPGARRIPADDSVALPASTLRALERYCDEGDGATATRVVANAVDQYLPQRRWERQAARHPERLPPALLAHLRPEVGERAKDFCERTRTPSGWFLDEAVLRLIAESEKDQWSHFLVRVPENVSSQLSKLAQESRYEVKNVVTRALQSYIAARIQDDSALAHRLAKLQHEAGAQMPLRFTKEAR